MTDTPQMVLYTRYSKNKTSGSFPSSSTNGFVGRCGKCRTVTLLPFRSKDVVSEKFTSWEDFDSGEESTGMLCETCAWCYKENKTFTWVADRNESFCWFGKPAEGDSFPVNILTSPVGNSTAVAVSLSGRKHVLPYLRWGMVTTEHGSFPWGEEHAKLYRICLSVVLEGYEKQVLKKFIPPSGLYSHEKWWKDWEVVNSSRGTLPWEVVYKTLPK